KPLQCTQNSKQPTYETRGSVAKTPYFPKTISRPALIMGETGDSGHDLGLGGMAELRGLLPFWGTFCQVRSGRPPRFKIRTDNGRFCLSAIKPFSLKAQAISKSCSMPSRKHRQSLRRNQRKPPGDCER